MARPKPKIKRARKRKRKAPVSVRTNSILTVELVKQFCDLVKTGLPVQSICDYIGVHNKTYYDWKRKGEMYLDGGDDKLEMFGYFVDQFKIAAAEYHLNLVKRLHSSRNVEWRRELAILERRDKRNFSKKDVGGGADEDYDPDERFL